MVVSVLVVWCLLSIPVGIVLGLSIREGMGAGPRLTASPDSDGAVEAPSAAAEELSEVPGARHSLPAQRRPATREGQLHQA